MAEFRATLSRRAALRVGGGLLAFALAGCKTEPSFGTRLGEARDVADIRFERLDGGGADRLGDFAGRWLLVNIWATWCAPCRAELPALQALADSLAGTGCQIIGVSTDANRFPVREFLRERRVFFARYFDKNARTVGSRLGVTAFPTTLLVDPESVLRWEVVGYADWAGERARRWLNEVTRGAAG